MSEPSGQHCLQSGKLRPPCISQDDDVALGDGYFSRMVCTGPRQLPDDVSYSAEPENVLCSYSLAEDLYKIHPHPYSSTVQRHYSHLKDSAYSSTETEQAANTELDNSQSTNIHMYMDARARYKAGDALCKAIQFLRKGDSMTKGGVAMMKLKETQMELEIVQGRKLKELEQDPLHIPFERCSEGVTNPCHGLDGLSYPGDPVQDTRARFKMRKLELAKLQQSMKRMRKRLETEEVRSQGMPSRSVRRMKEWLELKEQRRALLQDAHDRSTLNVRNQYALLRSS